jgi:hypothetical protein
MPYLLSFAGMSLTRKYVKNWYSIFATYARVKNSTEARFKNGVVLRVSRGDYGDFREELFRQYLTDNGFIYKERHGRPTIQTPTGVEMILLHDYSNIIDEIFVRKAYGADRLEKRVVIDIGASLGDSSLYFASIGASKVYGFEVDPDRYDLAIQNIHINNLNDTICLFNQAARSDLVFKLIEENKLNHVFLKLDCEGCEYEIIEKLPESIFDRIDDIVMEYHRKPHPIESKLKKMGFKVRREKKVLIPEGRIFASRNGK